MYISPHRCIDAVMHQLDADGARFPMRTGPRFVNTTIFALRIREGARCSDAVFASCLAAQPDAFLSRVHLAAFPVHGPDIRRHPPSLRTRDTEVNPFKSGDLPEPSRHSETFPTSNRTHVPFPDRPDPGGLCEPLRSEDPCDGLRVARRPRVAQPKNRRCSKFHGDKPLIFLVDFLWESRKRQAVGRFTLASLSGLKSPRNGAVCPSGKRMAGVWHPYGIRRADKAGPGCYRGWRKSRGRTCGNLRRLQHSS